MAGTPRLGLRGQIVLALSVAFIVTFSLLGVAVVRLADRATLREGARATERTAALIAELADAPDAPPMSFLCRATIDGDRVLGLEVARSGIEPERCGESRAEGDGGAVEARSERGTVVRIFTSTEGGAAGAALTDLLLLYVAVTGGAILMLAFVALTFLIVRPVEEVTRAAERLARGGRHVELSTRGAAEVARLGVAFNDMASQLRTERAALEARLVELEQTTVELRSAQDQVVRGERLASVGRLAAGVAHEIGNPLAAILGLVELSRDDELPAAERSELLARAQKETERIQKIIRDLLDFSRRGAVEPLEGETSNAVRVVEDAVALVAPQKDLRDVTIERVFAADDVLVRAPADALTQVVLNLLLNAADAVGGAGTIRIEVGEPDARGDVLLAVTDSGPGLAPEVHGRLFEPFVTTKPAGKGTGLGLAVCHTIVERLGGRITARNAPGGGARFEVHVPAASEALGT